MQDINLIPEELKNQKKREIQLKGLFKGSLIFLIVSVVISAGLLAYKLFLDKNIATLNSEISSEEQKIVSLKAMESKMVLLGEKLIFIQSVLDSRLEYSTLLKDIGNILPSGVSLTSLTISSSDKATIGGVTSSYALLSEVVRNISENAVLDTSVFDYSEVTSVNLKEETNRIEFSMTVYLKKGALNYGLKTN
ncbi:MAG: PilN domain-containing protein [bacterium]